MKSLPLVLLISIIGLSTSSCYFTKALKYKKYELKDIGDFEADKFHSWWNGFQFKQGTIDPTIKSSLDSMLIGSNKYAFLIIRNDSILYEFYNKNITDTTVLPSFSVAKSFVSTMIAMAKEEGKITSFNEPITNYLPELKSKDPRFEKITIQHLLDMRSGIKSSENYFNPMSDVLKLGFGKNINKKALHISIESEPNKAFEYRSINTQLLGMILERALDRKLQSYFYEKIFLPLEMEHDATWMVDDKEHREVRAFCCLNMTARDYAKFGRLYLNKGVYKGKRLLSEEWIRRTTHSDTMKAYGGYKNQWWKSEGSRMFNDSAACSQFLLKLNSSKKEIRKIVVQKTKKTLWFALYDQEGYYARGLLNQYIAIVPSTKTMIIHFGNSLLPHKPLKPGFEHTIEEYFLFK